MIEARQLNIRFDFVHSVKAISFCTVRVSGQDRHLREASRFPMAKHTLTGNIKRHRAFHSRVLGNRRDVLVYLPPGYRPFSPRRYPVLYLHDGQNVFDAATSFAEVERGPDQTPQLFTHLKLTKPPFILP